MQSVTSNAVNEVLKNGMYVGSCILWNETTVLTGTQDLVVLGAYNYNLINFQINVPTGFHKEFVLSAQVTTNGNISAWVQLNNISTYPKVTWSAPTFREISNSERFLLADIILEDTLDYGTMPGINLHLCSYSPEPAGNYVATIYGVTLSCFLVKD